MAKSEKGAPSKGKGQAKGGAAMPVAAQRGITIAALAATVVVVYLLQHVAGLGTGPTLGIGLLVLVAVVLVALFVMTEVRKLKIKQDATDTCKPILERYKQTGDVVRLVQDFDRWSRGDHDRKLAVDFAQATVEALVEGGHDKQAHRQLKVMESLVGDDQRAKQEFAIYKTQCETRLKAAKKNARRAHR